MIRTQIQLTEEQARQLKRIAAERGISVSAVIREAVEKAVAVDDGPARRKRALAAVGRFRSAFAAQADLPEVPEHPEQDTFELLRHLLRGPNLEFAADIRADLERHMFDLCGIIRTEEGLRGLQGILGNLRERYKLIGVGDRGKTFNTELMEAVELGFMLDVADTIVAAARTRDESRGGHYREDHPIRDDDHWLVHSLAYGEPDGNVRMEYKDVKLGPYIPMERKY